MIVFILPTLHSFSRRCVCLVILPICGGHGPWKLLVDSNIWCPNLLDTLPKNIQKLDFQLVSIYPCWSKKVNLVLSIKPVDLGPYYSATCGRIKSFEFPHWQRRSGPSIEELHLENHWFQFYCKTMVNSWFCVKPLSQSISLVKASQN